MILQRLALSIVVLFFVSVIVFAATQALPSHPAESILGRDATPERVAALREELDLDRPVVEQYLSWLGSVMTGDFGTSLASRRPVSDDIGPRATNSIVLLLLSGLIAIPLAIVLGAVSALRRDRLLDRAGLGMAFILTSVPEFVIGVFLTLLLATMVFEVVPAVALFPSGDSPFQHLDAMVLPTLALVLAVVPYLYRLVRASVIDVLESDYVEMAKLKGVPRRLILRRHAVPNALVPTIQASALVLAYLLSGVVIIEFLFRYPGLGTGLADAISNKDLPTLQAIALIYAAGIVLINLAADVLTILVNPRLRRGER